MEDNGILDLYFKRSESAIEETAAKYGGYCYTIAFSILASVLDSEECVNDTWLRAWNAIPPKRPAVLSAFLGRITRNLSLDRLRSAGAKKRGAGQMDVVLEELAECIPALDSVEQTAEDHRIAAILNQFLASLPETARIIFLRRYWYLLSVRDIAAGLGCSESKVKMTLSRTRIRLKHLLEKEGVTL